MDFIQGQSRYQRVLFPDSMEDYITEDNPVRVIDAFVDMLDLKELGLKSTPEVTGRPPYNPRDMLKLYVYGYFNKVRSSRRLEMESKRNLELIWLLSKLSPDHKTIAVFRSKNPKALKKVFRDFVKLCQRLDLYGCELVAIDGSKFSAVNSLDNNYNQKKLEGRIKMIDEKIERYLDELGKNDEMEKEVISHSKEEIEAMISGLKARRDSYESMGMELAETNRTQISTVDADARRMKQAGGSSDMSYNVQTAVDSKHCLVAEFDVTNLCNDVELLSSMAKSAKETLEADGLSVTADEGYFSATEIAECMASGITAHISSKHDSITMCVPVNEAVESGGGGATNEAKEFGNTGKNVYIKERNIALCPMGEKMYPASYRKSKGAGIYKNRAACKGCPRNGVCTEYEKEMQVKMRPEEFTKEYNDKDLKIRQIVYKADKEITKLRKSIAEHPFGTIKRSMDHAYCLLKGKAKVRGEFALAFLAYNLKRVINILGTEKLLQEMRA